MKVGIISFKENLVIAATTAVVTTRGSVADLEFPSNDRHISPPVDTIPTDALPRTVGGINVLKRRGKIQDMIIWLPEDDTT